MIKHLTLLISGLLLMFVCQSCTRRSTRDLDVEAAHRLMQAIQSFESEFGTINSMSSMSSTELMMSLSGKNPRNLNFYDFDRERNIDLQNGEFVCKSGRKLVVFFSQKELLVAIIDPADDLPAAPGVAPSTHMIRCTVIPRRKP